MLTQREKRDDESDEREAANRRDRKTLSLSLSRLSRRENTLGERSQREREGGGSVASTVVHARRSESRQANRGRSEQLAAWEDERLDAASARRFL